MQDLRRPGRKRPVGFLTVVMIALGSALAYAYWTSDGSGTGKAETADGGLALTVRQTSPVTSMGPGDVARVLSGDFDNPNSGAVYVTTVTVRIASVTRDPGASGACGADDYSLTGAVMPVHAQVARGSHVGSWAGATIEFNNKPNVNQDGCKGATVNLAYTLA